MQRSNWVIVPPASAEVTPPEEKSRAVALRESAGVTVDADDGSWTPLTGHINRRDLTPIAQRRMIELAAYLWESNRLANRLVELPTAFLLGEGVTLTAPDQQVQEWLDEFWNDPITRMDLNLEKHVRELGLFGELCMPAFVNPLTGHVRLGKVDPIAVEEVITDPENVATPIGVAVRNLSGNRKVYRVIYDGDDEDLFSRGAIIRRQAMTAGDCFFFRVNDLSTGRRGRSDILSAIDLADLYEQLLFGEAERAEILRRVVWDVTLKNATKEEVEDRASTIAAPQRDEVRVHNENEVWNALTPDLKAVDASETLSVIKGHLLGGSTIPIHWFGDGGDANLATATSMGEPTYKMFSQRQKLWKAILQAIGSYVIRQRLMAISSEIVGLAKMSEYKPLAVFPELTAKDVAKYTTALQQVVVAATQAVAAGVMSEETAVKLITLQANMLGVEIDPVEELEKARADAARRRSVSDYPDPDLTGEQMPAASPADLA